MSDLCNSITDTYNLGVCATAFALMGLKLSLLLQLLFNAAPDFKFNKALIGELMMLNFFFQMRLSAF